MAALRYTLWLVFLVGIAAVVNGADNLDAEEKAAEEATIKAADRKGIDKLWLGHFELKKTDDNFAKVLEACGYSKELTQKIIDMKHVDVCVTKKDNSYTMWTKGAGLHTKNTFEPGKEFTDKYIDGRSYKGIVKIVGENKATREETIGSEKLVMDVDLDADGFTVKYKIKDITSIQRFDRNKNKH